MKKLPISKTFGDFAKVFSPCQARQRLIVLVLGMLTFGAAVNSTLAQAQESPASSSGDATAEDIFSATLGHSISRDSNLFRNPDSGNVRADTINATSVSLRFDKPESRHRFQFVVAETFNRYSNFSDLNFNATNYSGAWLWSPTDDWNIRLNTSRAKALAPFEDTLGGGLRNVTTRDVTGLSADGRLTGNWYLVLGAVRTDNKSEQGVISQPDERTNSGEVGIRYATDAGNSVTLLQRKVEGEYQNQSTTIAGSGFDENITALTGAWMVSDKSDFRVELSRRERSNEQVGQRDFSRPSGLLGYTWRPTEPLTFAFTAERVSLPLVDPSFSYQEIDRFMFAPSWRFSEKISLLMRLARAESNYRGQGNVPPVGSAPQNKTNTAEVGVAWTPVDRLTLGARLWHEQRTDTRSTFEYEADVLGINASWMFW